MYSNNGASYRQQPDGPGGEGDCVVLRVDNITTCFETPRGAVNVVDGVSFSLVRGKVLGIIGESGCGKTVTTLSVIRLLPRGGRTTGGRVIYGGRDLLRIPETDMRRLRGGSISMIFQEPASSFNPFLKISTQILETIRLHNDVGKHEARRIALELLDSVGIPDPDKRIEDYPHQFSGGMLQRVLVAMAAGCNPQVILADEPTSNLDVTTQDITLDSIKKVSDQSGAAMLLVTHDFGVAARMCDMICVMYAGRLIETAPASEFFREPRHPYAKALMNAVPDVRIRNTAAPASIGGKPPDFNNLPAGCAFHPRCPYPTAVCRTQAPPEFRYGNRTVRCWLHGEGDHPQACHNHGE
ncbi:MAG: ABC transporter ATP-binding protein [Spirochaetales bacterium]|nr:ABC transporter ATP-binding protein [Spirochaetales bacterium]